LVAALVSEQSRMKLPAYTRVTVASSELGEAVPVSYAADSVLVFSQHEKPVFAIVIEVQRRQEQRKRWTWPQYVTSVSAEHQCPTLLLVICPTRTVATWARNLANRNTFALPWLTWTPIVIGPEEVPAIHDPATAIHDPELTMLSIITHGQTDPTPYADAFIAAILTIDDTDRNRARRYNDLVITSLPAPAAHILEDIMKTTTPSYTERITQAAEAEGEARGEARGLAEGEARGLAEGEARSLLTILHTRGFTISADTRERITTCTDPQQLERWIQRAITIEDINQLLTP